MITVRTEGFARFPSLVKVLVISRRRDFLGRVGLMAQLNPGLKGPCQNSLTLISSSPSLLPITLWPCSPWIFKQSRLPSAPRWVGLSQSVEGPETENRFSREGKDGIWPQDYDTETLSSFQPCQACPTNFRLKIAAFTLHLNIQTVAGPAHFGLASPTVLTSSIK